jgi:gas vesicle structural protein
MTREVDLASARAAAEQAVLGADDGEQLVLSDLINRVLDKGVVISGQVTIAVADVDLIALDLRLLVSSIETAITRAGEAGASSSR